MTQRGTASPSPAVRGKAARPGPSSPRLAGIDAARGLALLGMMATHVLPTFEANAQLTPTWTGLVLSGRASALFAVLAGLGLALSTGKQQPLEGPGLAAARRGIACRALVVGAVGFSLGGLEINIAIILVHYAALFLCILPFIGLGLKHLLWLAAAWVLASPVLAFLLRPWLLAPRPPLKLGRNPQWEDLSAPAKLLGDVFLTGYYPVVQWIAYLLIGLAIGRLALTGAAVPVLLLAGGTVLAVLAKWSSMVMMDDWGGRAALQAQLRDPDYPLDSVLQVNVAGLEQSGSWWWLAVSSPHSGAPLDLLHTAGVAAAAIGACLLLGRIGQLIKLDILLLLRGAGAATLSLYTAHLCLMAALYEQRLPVGWTLEGVYWAQAVTVLMIGAAIAALGRRGPLEWLAHAASRIGSYQPSRLR